VNKEEYAKLTRPHARALRQLLLEFEFFIADAGKINVFSLEGRLKTFESAVEKARRLALPVGELQDLVGIRLVLATADEVDVMAAFIHDAAHRKRLKIASDLVVDRSNGYRARHIILDVEPEVTHSVYTAKVEVQLQTIMQHAFNFVSRAWVYKNDRAYSPDWRDQFRSVAGTLRNLDRDIASLHEGVLQSAASGSDDEPLTPFSYQRVFKDEFDEDVSLPDAVWSARLLIDMHLSTNGELRAFLRRPDILAVRDRLAKLEGRARELLGGLCEMSASSFFMFWGVRAAGANELIDKIVASADNPKT
jgi:ppGpp synthetase/RelA/SpoT-type nucleotidyltranferase